MTFPKIRLYCPECKEEMTLVNTPKPEPSIIIGYDQVVEYNYQCLSNERHEGKWHDTEGNIVDDSLITQEKSMIYNKGGSNWCDISSNEYIMIMRILIPSIYKNLTEISFKSKVNVWLIDGINLLIEPIFDGKEEE